MNVRELLETPPPVHSFTAAEDQLVYGRLGRRRDTLSRVERVPLGGDWFRLGPVGLLHVDRAALAAGVTALVQRLEAAPGEASFVAPNAWVRSVVIDAEELPHQREEADDVVRWRLKKLLPCRPEDVRLDYVASGGRGRMLVVLALDRPMAVVEETFAASGVNLGRIEPAALALTALLPPSPTPILLGAVDAHALALVVLVEGKPVLMRNKPLPADPARAAVFITRELGRTLAHAREQERIEGPVEVWLAAGEAAGTAEIGRWGDAQAEVRINALAVGTGRVPVGSGVADVRLWSLLGTAWAGAL